MGLTGYGIGILAVALLASVGLNKCQADRLETAKVKQVQTEQQRDQEIQNRTAAEKQTKLLNEVIASYEPKLQAISQLAADIGRLGAAVSVCNKQTAAFPAAFAAASDHPDAAPTSEQPRDAAVVLQELAAKFAESSDRNAEQLNALIDWLEKALPPTPPTR